MTRLQLFLCLTVVPAFCLCAASLPWKNTDPQTWSAHDVDRVLSDSPWARPIGATFALADDNTPPSPTIDVPQAGMQNPRNAATDGRWDGGVGRVQRNGPPTLIVTVRWDSALPVRQALERSHSALSFTKEQLQRDYIIGVLGLVPANRYNRPQLNQSSGDGIDVRNPEEMLEGVMHYSRLYPRNEPPIQPEDVKLDNSTGTLLLFFPRSRPIAPSVKEVLFETRFGSMSVTGRFRLKDMMYGGTLEL